MCYYLQYIFQFIGQFNMHKCEEILVCTSVGKSSTFIFQMLSFMLAQLFCYADYQINDKNILWFFKAVLKFKVSLADTRIVS